MQWNIGEDEAFKPPEHQLEGKPAKVIVSCTLSGDLNFRLPVDRPYLSLVPCGTSVRSLCCWQAAASFAAVAGATAIAINFCSLPL